MNKKKLYISIIAFAVILATIIIILIIRNKKYISEISENTDNINNIFSDYDFSDDFDDTSYIYLTESSNYFFEVIEYGIYRNIYKISKETGTAEILCNNPQCTHTDDTCSAYLGIDEDGITISYYNDRLYYTRTYKIEDESRIERWIVSMDLEGKDRKKEVKINDSLYNSDSGYGISMKVYGKDVYLIKSYSEPDEMGISHTLSCEIYKIDLETKEMNKIYEKSHKGMYAGICAKEDNNVYMFVELLDENDYTKIENYLTLVYDTDTDSIIEEEGDYIIEGISEENRFYSRIDGNERIIYVKKANSEEYEEIYNMGKEGIECGIDIYNDYIIINNWPVRDREAEDKAITILDTDGNFIKEISTYTYTSDTKIANGYLFIEKKNENEKYDIYVCPIETEANTWTKIN